MSELFLHIGSHKTGTTSIQKACAQLAGPHAHESVTYLDIRPGGTPVVKSGGRLADFRAHIRLDAADEVFRPERRGRYIASDESFFWISEPDTVHQFAALLRERFSTVTVLCYLRRQDLLAVSHRKQVGHGLPSARFYGAEATPLPTYQPHFQRYFNYAEKLSNIWASAFGKENIQVVSYDGITAAGGDVVADFARRTNAPLDISKPLRANRSLKGNKTLLGIKLVEMGVPAPRRREILKALPGAGTFRPTRAEAEAFLAHFEAANQQLAQDWTWEGAPFVFDRSFEMYPESDTACWSGKDMEQVIEAIVNGMRKRAS